MQNLVFYEVFLRRAALVSVRVGLPVRISVFSLPFHYRLDLILYVFWVLGDVALSHDQVIRLFWAMKELRDGLVAIHSRQEAVIGII